MSNYPVLLFHSTDDRDLLSLRGLGNIRSELFEKFVVRLKKEFDIVGLSDMIRFISGDTRAGENLIAITFDDGPRSYASLAVPILQAHGVPSTCFLITDCLDDREIYWRYLYNYCIQGGAGRELAAFINEEYRTDIRPEEIVSFSRNHFNKAKNRRIIERLLEGVVSEEKYREREKGLFLSMEDIGSLKQNPLVSFGIHTRSHPVLRGLSDDEIHNEIAGSLDFYRNRISEDVPAFSVPFGRLFRDYDERTISIAESLGVRIILSAYGGGNALGQPLYNIRRISVHEEEIRDENMDAFIDTLRSPAVPAGYAEGERRLAGLLSSGK